MRNELLSKTIYILREVKKRFKNPAVLWSTGKDSTACLHMIKEAFFGEIPFPVVHIDTSYKFKEIYEFRARLAKEWNLNLVITQNKKALSKVDPREDKFECCMNLKTLALKNLLEQEKYDALILSIRWDEHPIRGMERFFSPRDSSWHWRVVRDKTPEEMKEGDAPVVSEQDAEMGGWDIYATDFGKECSHVRVHPILHWTESEIWQYVKENNIPWNPLYQSRNGLRYRSLGCEPCTEPVKSDAKTIDEIVEELRVTRILERSGRSQDKEKIIEKLRMLGYM